MNVEHGRIILSLFNSDQNKLNLIMSVYCRDIVEFVCFVFLGSLSKWQHRIASHQKSAIHSISLWFKWKLQVGHNATNSKSVSIKNTMNLSAAIWCPNLQSRRYLRLELLLSFACSNNTRSVRFSNLFPFYFQWNIKNQRHPVPSCSISQPQRRPGAFFPKCCQTQTLLITEHPALETLIDLAVGPIMSRLCEPRLRLDLCKSLVPILFL